MSPYRIVLADDHAIAADAEGYLLKEIADLLYISIRTVENHRANIMQKLNIRKAANLVKYAIRKGYTTPTT